MSFKTCDSVPGFSLESINYIHSPYKFDVEHVIALQSTQGIGPHLAARVNSHVFSRVAAGTWVTSRVTAEMILQSSCLLSEVSTPVWLNQTTHESP